MNKEVVVVLSHLPWDFPCDFIKHTSFELAKKARVIVYNPFYFPTFKNLIFEKDRRKEWLALFKEKEVIYFPPLAVLPFQRFKVIEKLNIRLNLFFFRLFYLFNFGFKKPIFWAFSYPMSEFKDYFGWGKLLVYDRVDQSASLDEKANLKLMKMDIDLLAVSNIVFVNSPYSLKYVKKFNKNSHLVPCGCSIDLFQDKKVTKLEEMGKIQRPMIGLIGSIDHRLDFKLLSTLIRRKKEWNFVFIGGSFSDDARQFEKVNLKLHLKNLGKLPNVYFLGQKPKKLMPDYIAGFDVCLIPYDITQEFVAGCNPMKLYEYLIMGKPVVSTPIEAVEVFSPTVKVGNSADFFEKSIKGFLEMGDKRAEVEKRKKIAKDNSWKNKVELMWRRLGYN